MEGWKDESRRIEGWKDGSPREIKNGRMGWPPYTVLHFSAFILFLNTKCPF